MINKQVMKDAVKYFREHGIISSGIVQRKFKITGNAAVELCKSIEKRFPNLWREGRERMNIR